MRSWGWGAERWGKEEHEVSAGSPMLRWSVDCRLWARYGRKTGDGKPRQGRMSEADAGGPTFEVTVVSGGFVKTGTLNIKGLVVIYDY